MSLRSLLSKFLSLSHRDRVLLVQTAFLLLGIKLGLKAIAVQKLRRLLASYTDRSPTATIPAERLMWAVEVATRVIPGGAKCLARALAAQFLLLRHGYAAQLHLGVAKDDCGRFEAHAWVESNGKVAIGRLQNWERFTPLVRWDR